MIKQASKKEKELFDRKLKEHEQDKNLIIPEGVVKIRIDDEFNYGSDVDAPYVSEHGEIGFIIHHYESDHTSDPSVLVVLQKSGKLKKCRISQISAIN